ncbi:MAG TPA: DinB family protein, partial [Actinomycetota bacterium]|nr:DinB family protein [Actinomycetota bacterium]
TILWKVDGLDDEQLRRVIVASGLTLLGLVKHLTAVEHGWFAVNFAATGEPHMFESEDDPDLDFHVQPDETTPQILEGYKRACERSREIYASADSLDATFTHPRRGTMSLRWMMNHMIEETARHAGHADIMRELIDGATGY